jgi:hypothetical protein
MVREQIANLYYAGSNPVGHSKKDFLSFQYLTSKCLILLTIFFVALISSFLYTVFVSERQGVSPMNLSETDHDISRETLCLP